MLISGRGKAPSSLRCVGSSDLLGARPPAPSRQACPRRRQPTGLPIRTPPRRSAYVPARTYVRSSLVNELGVRRIGEPVTADTTTAPRERQAEFGADLIRVFVDRPRRAQFAQHLHSPF